MVRRAGEVSFFAECATTTPLPLAPPPEGAVLASVDPPAACEVEIAAPVAPPFLPQVHAEGSCVPPVAAAVIVVTTATARIREMTNSVRVGRQSRLPEAAGGLNLRIYFPLVVALPGCPGAQRGRYSPGPAPRRELRARVGSSRDDSPSSVSAASGATAVGWWAFRFETRPRGCCLRFLNGTGIDASTLGGPLRLVNGVPPQTISCRPRAPRRSREGRRARTSRSHRASASRRSCGARWCYATR